MLADRIWETRKQGNITVEDFATIPNLRITPRTVELCRVCITCSHYGYAKQTQSDDMEEYLAEYMVDSSLTNVDNCENLIATPLTYERVWTKNSSQNPPVSKLHYTTTPLAEPRRIPSSPYRNTQVNHEIKCELDHTFPKQRHLA